MNKYDDLRAERDTLAMNYDELKRERDGIEQKYNDVMSALKRSKMEHGLCEPVERHACTACAAIRRLEKHLAEWKGPRVILA